LNEITEVMMHRKSIRKYRDEIPSDEVIETIVKHWMPVFLQGSIMNFITTILIWLFWLIIIYMTYKHVVLILFSPLLGSLSEKVDEVKTGEKAPPFTFSQMIRDLRRSLIINLRNLLLTIIFSILAWLTIFIPIIGIFLSPVLLIIIQAYYDGFGLMDYSLERKRMSVKQSIRFTRQNRWRTIGAGSGFMLLMLVPIIGWFFAPTYGTVAATLSALDVLSPTDD